MKKKNVREHTLRRVESDDVTCEKFAVLDTRNIVDPQETDWFAVIATGDDGRKEAIVYDGDRPMFCLQKTSGGRAEMKAKTASRYVATRTDDDGTTGEVHISPELSPIFVNGQLGIGIRTNRVTGCIAESDRIVYCTDNDGRLRRWVAVNEVTGETMFQLRLECEGRNSREVMSYIATVDESVEDPALALLYLLYLVLTKDEWYDNIDIFDARAGRNGEKALEDIEHLYDARFDASAH